VDILLLPHLWKRGHVMPPPSSPGDGQRLLRLLVNITSFVAFILVIACLYWGQTVLVPVAMAFLLTFLLQPVVALFQRARLGRTLSVLLVVLITGIGFAGVGWVVGAQITGLTYDLGHNPQYKAHIKQKLAALRGIGKDSTLDSFQGVINDIMEEFAQGTAPAAPTDQPRVVVREGSSPLATVLAISQPLLEPLGTAAFVAVLVIFMLLQYEDLRNRLIGLVGSGQLTVTTRALDDAGQRVSRYLLMQFMINGSYGLVTALVLFLIGIPYAVLWGFLAAVLRYIPYVGPWIAAFFPITMSLVAFPEWLQLGLVVGMFVLLELWSNMLMEPWLYGQSLGVSEVGLLVVTGFWTWLWGPIGLVLSTPLTVCLVVLGRHVPHLQFFDMLFGKAPALDPPVVYYQRLLARDQEEATELVEDYIKDHTLETVYDEILIPALLLAWQDRKQGQLAGEDEAFILQATQDIVAELGATTGEPAEGDYAACEATGAPAPSPVLILGCPAHHEAEEVIVQMLRQLMQPAGCQVEVASTRTHASDIAARIRQERPSLIFIAVLPGGLPQTRYLCRHLHKAFPELHIVVGYWGDKEEFDKILVRLRQAGASSLTTSLLQSRSRISALTTDVVPQPQLPPLGREVAEAR
jgi:predicted PurR-regulated permease PerM